MKRTRVCSATKNMDGSNVIFKDRIATVNNDWIIAEGIEGFMHSLKEPTFSVAKFFSYVFLGWLKPDGEISFVQGSGRSSSQ
jgi:hypothetical protein